jgi:hypothetical protein
MTKRKARLSSTITSQHARYKSERTLHTLAEPALLRAQISSRLGSVLALEHFAQRGHNHEYRA